jgi:hypothetical protein
MRPFTLILLILVCRFLAGTANADDATTTLFRDHVAGILGQRCLGCHSAADRKGGLSLATAADALRGGDGGAAIVPGDVAGSLLMDMVSGEAPEMPKDAKPLSADEQQVIRRWIEQGAAWPEEYTITPPQVTDTDWWSLCPLVRPAVPPVSAADEAYVCTPIDNFIIAQQRARGLAPSPRADRRTLIRRLYFDLIGLPPDYDEVEAFVADDDPQAYACLVDRLLNSPHYGERWARHWLDVVHYGDTHGYDKDKPRPNAWPYRDYVIRSFNDDKPYARFVMEQIAGDVLWPGERDGIEATGFIAAGPWDFIGHAEVPETKYDGQVARNLDRDDMVTSTINTFLSLTVQCARCHSHKFDPITQQQYYSLQSVFAALDRADRPYDIDQALAQRRRELVGRQQQIQQRQEQLAADVKQRYGDELAALDQRLEQARTSARQEARAAYGYHSQIGARPDEVKWVQVDLGQPTSLQSVTLVGAHDDFNGIGAGFGFPVRFRVELSSAADFSDNVTVIADHTQEDFANPGVTPLVLPAGNQTARYLRVTATRLAFRQNDYIFALAEVLATTPAGVNAARGANVDSLDSIEAPPRWQRVNLVDGYYVGSDQDPASQQELTALAQQRDALIQEHVPAALRREAVELQEQQRQVQDELESLPVQHLVYAGTVHHGSGAFQGTGATGGRPREIRVLLRGEIRNPGPLVGPGTLAIVPGIDWHFDLPAEHTEGDRRVALAHWLVRPDNPLVWRSLVNRIWLYHFGRGIVDSPNDFGRMDQLPSHPELLDWLAVEFRDGGQSIKDLQRLIVTSHVYQQLGTDNPNYTAIDADNRLLWRMNRQLLSAEAIRDSVLAVSGQLDRQMYGPAFMDFVVERPEHSPHYEYHKYNPDDPTTHRRSVYRFLVRSQQQPFMQSLGCADPSQSVAKRDSALTSIQALTLMNNRFMVRMSEHFAERLQQQTTDPAEQIDLAYRIALARRPTAEETNELTAFVQQFGLPYACRVVLNLNEFVFVD